MIKLERICSLSLAKNAGQDRPADLLPHFDRLVPDVVGMHGECRVGNIGHVEIFCFCLVLEAIQTLSGDLTRRRTCSSASRK